MSGRLRVLGVLSIMGVAVLAGGSPAVAGGPTSVLLSVPGEGRVAALYNGNPDYQALADDVGAFATTGAPAASPPPLPQGSVVTLTWLIHDVSPWRVDRVHVSAAGEAWIETQSTDGSADVGATAVVWHRASDGDGLRALLTKLGVNPLQPAPPASSSAYSSAVEPAPVGAAAAPAAAPEPEPAFQAWTWALVGLVAGVALTVAGEQAWSRRRRKDAATPRPAAGPPYVSVE
jgi:hypothetical protein